jgi:hypothetical protein
MQTETLFSSASGVHYTPAAIIERARALLDGIDLDPASNAAANAIVKADRYFYDPFSFNDEANGLPDGLNLSWHCRTLWLNPPFSTEKRLKSGMIALNADGKPIRQRVIEQWVSRWRAAIRSREVGAAMLLVPARTDTEWFQPLLGLPMCLVSGRLTFSEAKNSAPFPTVMVYVGPVVELFYTLFEEVGVCGKFER